MKKGIATNLHSLCADTVTWMEGKRFAAGTTQDEVVSWLRELGIEPVQVTYRDFLVRKYNT
jgi:hypothetical protein